MDFAESSISVSVPLDDEGFFDRRCPQPECSQPFKVFFEDWREKVQDERAYCPFCRHEAEAQAFNTAEQDRYFQEVALAEVQRQLGAMLSGISSRFNHRQPRQSLLSFRMDVKTAPIPLPVMPDVEEVLSLRIECEECGCRVAVIGAGFFCPACGHNSADLMFDQSLTKVEAALNAIPQIRVALPDKDQRAQVVQALIENQIGNLVSAFSRFAEAIYPNLPNSVIKPRRNAFQSLATGSDLWEKAGGTAYTRILESSDYRELQRMFQLRHLLEHQQGIVDNDYLDKSQDSRFRLGQRVVVQEAEVFHYIETVRVLGHGIGADVGKTERSDRT